LRASIEAEGILVYYYLVGPAKDLWRSCFHGGRRSQEKGEEKEGAQDALQLLLLQERIPVLLELPLRFRDLPGLHGREPLGHDVQ
jgi:hypothetical protein